MRKVQNKGLASLQAAKSLLDDYLKQGSDRAAVVDARRLLAFAEAEMRRLLVVRATRTRQGANIEYAVENINGKPLLTEKRIGSTSKPYRTSKETYDLAAAVLRDATGPLDFFEIAELISRSAGVIQPTHEVRMLLRLWQHVQPPMLIRERRKYRRTVEDFYAESQQQWRKLSSNQ